MSHAFLVHFFVGLNVTDFVSYKIYMLAMFFLYPPPPPFLLKLIQYVHFQSRILHVTCFLGALNFLRCRADGYFKLPTQ